MPWIVFRLRFAKPLVGDPERSAATAEILTRPCFASLTRVLAKDKDRFVKGAKATAPTIASYLASDTYDGAILESGAAGDVVASAEITSGQHARDWPASPTRLNGYIAVPFARETMTEVVRAACDLALVLDARSGAIAVETEYRRAQRWGLETARPQPRPGLSERRMKERRAQARFDEDLATKVSGPEWGTLLGPAHLPQVDLSAIEASGAFHRVVHLGPSLVYLQLTADPLADLTEAIEARLDRAREVLAPVLMDTTKLDS